MKNPIDLSDIEACVLIVVLSERLKAMQMIQNKTEEDDRFIEIVKKIEKKILEIPDEEN